MPHPTTIRQTRTAEFSACCEAGRPSTGSVAPTPDTAARDTPFPDETASQYAFDASLIPLIPGREILRNAAQPEPAQGYGCCTSYRRAYSAPLAWRNVVTLYFAPVSSSAW